MQEMSSLNSTPSKIVGVPSSRQMLRRCRSPWHSRTKPVTASGVEAIGMVFDEPARVSAASRAHATWSRTPAPCLDQALSHCRRRPRPFPPGRRGPSSTNAPACSCTIADASRSMRRNVEAAAFGQTVEQRVLIESPHLDQPVDGRAAAANRQRPSDSRVTARTPRYRAGAVRRLSRTSASHATRLQLDRREIDVVEVDRAFQLERPIAASQTTLMCVSIRSTGPDAGP